jgi:hypothetical protein
MSEVIASASTTSVLIATVEVRVVVQMRPGRCKLLVLVYHQNQIEQLLLGVKNNPKPCSGHGNVCPSGVQALVTIGLSRTSQKMGVILQHRSVFVPHAEELAISSRSRTGEWPEAGAEVTK